MVDEAETIKKFREWGTHQPRVDLLHMVEHGACNAELVYFIIELYTASELQEVMEE
ncbi:unnamed protein product [marine sediment metagenome]|uniref:Uncharacterized protein n=1 Tax=marine sediment metagenome TaxID=412755 RepID=X0REQ4_9ZZZZ